MKKVKGSTPGNTEARSRAGQPRNGSRSTPFRLRLLIFGLVAALVATATFVLVRPFAGSGDSSGTPVRIDMAGFAPKALAAKAGEVVTLRLINPDSEFHTDGGGKHQFAIAELGVDTVVNPKSEKAITFRVSAPGTYKFYCDICCGGKDNPTMWGTLTVSA